MAAPGRKKPRTRANDRPCRRCGARDWIIDNRGWRKCRLCQRAISSKRAKARRREDPCWNLLVAAKARATKRGEPFTLTEADISEVWPADNRCPVLGIPFQRQDGKRTGASPSLDRLNNAWGYQKGNIAVVSWRANNLKSDATASELEKIVNWMRLNGLD